MQKELLYDSEAYYYKLDENGELTYDEYGDNYDEFMADEDYKNMLATLDEMDRGRQVKIEASLGLWDGRRRGYAYKDSFRKAFELCLINGDMMIEVMKTGKHTVKVKIVHHDGTNYYTLKDY